MGLVSIIRGLQPHIIINNRTGLPEDHDTPEQTIGKFQNTRPWESCITIARQWAWKPNDTLKTLEQCLHTLVRCAGGDGNLLFNVGPMPDGRIEPRQVERLKEMGAWLARYGESIYGTRGGPWKPDGAMVSTRRGNFVFVHVLRWESDVVTLPNLPRKVLSATLLGGGKVDFRQNADMLTISIPAGARKEIDAIVKLELDGSAEDLEPLEPSPRVKSASSPR
jgi:alpha-L-fucosidase